MYIQTKPEKIYCQEACCKGMTLKGEKKSQKTAGMQEEMMDKPDGKHQVNTNTVI